MVTQYTAGANASLSALATYTVVEATPAVYYDKAIITNGAAYHDLDVQIYYPSGIDFSKPVPCLVWVSIGGYTVDSWDSQDAYGNLASAGMIVMAVGGRIEGDNPQSPGDTSADSAKKKAVRAAGIDVKRALEYARSHLTDGTNYQIHPDMIFLGGPSAGSQIALHHCINTPSHGIAGVVAVNTGFGFDLDGGTSTADIRSFGDETDWTNGDPRVVSYISGADVIIGITHVDALDAVFDLDAATVNDNHPHYDPTGNHNWNNTSKTTTSKVDASTITQEAANIEFIVNVISTIADKSGNVAIV